MAASEVEQKHVTKMVRVSPETYDLIAEIGKYNETIDDIVKRIALAYRDWGRDFELYRSIVPGCSCMYHLVKDCPVHKNA